ncbi:hypothetical protein ERX46_11695 [Brumimicrobium glaciale]|uniref:Uncharacterized protein n=1 Tax=Brumimicrobium glaciale TaxID=200475 RepID=A0A4Q4KJS6_9FLAO|nr:hypothetical protein [Brumimicrobium glaciale]RYM33593.1 hypothetical protein ERX46_11695 [Brumimicrobium glaciale]
MNKLLLIFFLFIILNACQTQEKVKDHETYTYLQVCFEDYYLNYDVEITPLLDEFEVLLLKEGHITDTTGEAYKNLFDSLAVNDYFKPPLKKEDFNNTVLYKNPSNIIECAETLFSVDSIQIVKTNFSKIASKINHEIEKGEDISIHYFFDLYKRELTDDEIRAPYIKQSVLLLLYRWYFKSKYDRDMKIEDTQGSKK